MNGAHADTPRPAVSLAPKESQSASRRIVLRSPRCCWDAETLAAVRGTARPQSLLATSFVLHGLLVLAAFDRGLFALSWTTDVECVATVELS
jgi:hypothetical protein